MKGQSTCDCAHYMTQVDERDILRLTAYSLRYTCARTQCVNTLRDGLALMPVAVTLLVTLLRLEAPHRDQTAHMRRLRPLDPKPSGILTRSLTSMQQIGCLSLMAMSPDLSRLLLGARNHGHLPRWLVNCCLPPSRSATLPSVTCLYGHSGRCAQRSLPE